MRLISKITLLYVLLSILVFGIGGLVVYRTVKDVVRQETDYSLLFDLRRLQRSIAEGTAIHTLETRRVRITPVEQRHPDRRNRLFSDTLMMHRPVGGLEPFRKLTAVRTVNGQHYRFEISDVFIESEDMSSGVFKVMIWLFLALSGVLILFSFLISKWLLRPFKLSLKKIATFNIKDTEALELPETNTREFNELNHFLDQMTSKVREDYRALKEFTENASHELQTPIAIAQGKLELLQESPNLSKEETELIGEAQQSLYRLSRMGKSLTLLTKIENQEFANPELLDFSEVVRSNVNNYQEFAELKNVELKSETQPGVMLRIDAALADILMGNLLKNAIQHNLDPGWIVVQLSEKNLTVSNSGTAPGQSPETFFERFKKDRQSSSSLGLGLAIVKKIAERSNLAVSYVYEQQAHRVRVDFRQGNS